MTPACQLMDVLTNMLFSQITMLESECCKGVVQEGGCSLEPGERNKPRLPGPRDSVMIFFEDDPFSGCRKRRSAKGVRSLFCFRDPFGHFLVTFSDASVTFFVTFLPNSFSWIPFAAG